ncbi:unnamed protein product [Aspergillus oryzae var. brunneus]|uniref:Unnamed protein product n=2 Tax=Aspergillus oryzae TaxID=5062 RepID=A0AAN4YPU1_ASPOZ|nr:unnamed protein product [Aspergillus oryzae]GMG42342.1 unnamed protein product [Aspergillus oryzae var. brunneus]
MAGGAATSAGVSQGSGSNGDDATAISPYETNPDNIPQDDPFLKQSPHYGRYAPRDDDFKPRYDHWWQSDPDAISHWENIVKENLSPENSLNLQEGRQAYSVGSVIIRVDKDDVVDTTAERYSCANANELSAARKAEDALKALDITVPVIHFCGTVDGNNVTVESRIPGVSLEVAWRYLSTEQINKFKQECRQILEHMASIDPAPDSPSYVCSGLNSQLPPEIQEMEKDVLFQEKMEDEILCLVHNNMTPSNIIVNDDRVVGIIGWRHSGYFGFRRANTIHRRFRMPTWSSLEAAGGNVEAWADIYENLLNAKVGSKLEASQDTPGPQVKTEPSLVTLDKVPESDEIDNKSISSQIDGVNTPGEHPTPKKIADLKHGRGSRASSSDRSSPANSVKAASGRKSTPGGAKKGTAKKSTAKKRKITEEDTESVDGHQSNTPSSRTSKTPGVKKQGSASVAGSPAPESRTKRKKGAKKRKAPKKAAAKEEEHEEEEEEEASTDENELFCICRKPDNHTWMIACDGECDDWFHGKCVNIDPKDADLIDNRGGILTAGDLKAVIMDVSSAAEFRKLGERIVSLPPDDPETDTKEKDKKKLGLDFAPDDLTYSPDEASKIEELRKRRDELLHRRGMLNARNTFVNLVRQRSKSVLEKLKQAEPKGGWKDICGFDSRLAWSDEEFDEWRLSEVGAKTLEDGTPEALASSYPDTTDIDGDTVMNGVKAEEDDISSLSRGICTKKRCERHKQWVKVQQQEILFEEDTVNQDLAKCEKEAQNVVERAVLRMWAEKENAQNGCQ